MTPTNFRKPRTGPALLRIRLRNGWIADGATVGGYTADKLRWTETGSDGDILAVERVEVMIANATPWNVVSGGY